MKKMRVTVNGTTYDVEVELIEDTDGEHSYGFPAGHRTRPGAEGGPARPPVATASIAHPIKQPSAPSSNQLTSPIAGMVTEIKVREGATVKENDLLMNIEAMKMNTHICSPVAGKIASIRVKEKDGVTQGQVLITFA